MITYKTQIHLQSERTQYTDFVFTSGDVMAYRLCFSFFSNGIAYDVTGCGLTVKAKRADGTMIVDVGVVEENGVAYYDVKSDVYAIPGLLSMEVALSLPTGGYVTAKELVMEVRDGYGEQDLVAKDTVPVLAKLMHKANQAEGALKEAERVLSGVAGLSVAAVAVESGAPTVEKSEENGAILLTFGIPQGEKGEAGPQGEKGESGYAPQKGIDYWTEADKAEIHSYVDDAILGGAW